MAIFGYKGKDGAVNMCLTGVVTQEPKLNNKGDRVKLSMAYRKKTYMNVEAWADSDVGRVLACMEKGDVILAVGEWQQWEHNGNQYETLRADFIQTLPGLSAEAVAGEPQTASATETGGFGELEAPGEELPF